MRGGMAEHDGKEFFKVYLPFQSSRMLRVPPAFVKHFNGSIPNNAILKDLSGRLWHVEVEEAENGVFLKNGWQRFASDHFLEHGNFLVFRYDGNSLFDVKIYGNNGCMKEETLVNEDVKPEINTEEQSEEEHICPKPTGRCKHMCPGVGMGGSKQCKRFRCLRGRCESRTIASSRTSDGSRASDALQFAVPENPHFIASVHPKTPNLLIIPRQLIIEHSIRIKPDMILRNQNGKLWPVKVDFRKDGRMSFVKGWRSFWEENGIGYDDKCIFEFLFNGRRCLRREIQVLIVRSKGKAKVSSRQGKQKLLCSDTKPFGLIS
ncbi:putative B3 domain-containing protein At5g66980 isoform X2 [Diospyros lotus]|uniref:putative B3 domain-containing protein At5g66980 isoform X2 n=1 Tax=Diospyros lotus TaxID=55363 RepID=UPI00224DA886|nr:putative B3 domain-containing protein At5g66980 isoform X2 [Diospyros lotus]